MQINKILSASLIDLIFDGHNKDYGAYELRKNYSKRINKALLITLTIAAFICSTVILASTSKKGISKNRMGPQVEIAKLPEVKKIEPLPEPERKQEVKPPKTEIYTAPVIKPTDDIQNPPPTQDDLKDARIGDIKTPGPSDDDIPKPEDLDKKGVVEKQPTAPVDDTPLSFVEIDAKFSGNWKAFLERNLNGNVGVDNGAPTGSYSVIIQFVVDKEGNISDIRPLTNHGYGFEQEAIRVIKKAPKWEPAIQNGFQVKAYKKQVIVFQINDGE